MPTLPSNSVAEHGSLDRRTWMSESVCGSRRMRGRARLQGVHVSLTESLKSGF